MDSSSCTEEASTPSSPLLGQEEAIKVLAQFKALADTKTELRN